MTVVELNGEKVGRCRGKKTGSLDENIADLQRKIEELKEQKSKRAAELRSAMAVAKELKSSMILATHRAFSLYWES